MRRLQLIPLKFRPDFLFLSLLAGLLLMVSAPVQATRGITIDVNWFEVWGDAQNGDIIPLSFPVNYGAGLQSQVTVNLPQNWDFDSNGFASVGLTFTNSPSDSLFATVGPADLFSMQVPAVSISNAHQVSTPEQRVSTGSNFNFGIIQQADMSPPYFCPPTSFCEAYGPLVDGANFQFINLASSGTLGDFELNITCALYPCANIGFNLAGDTFSSDTFDPLNPPANLVQFSDNSGVRSWSFVFRNPRAVPEPSTWASMLLGFALIGTALGRQRSRRLSSS